MKLILQFLKPHRTLCAATILLLIIDVTGALIISSFAAELLNLGVSGTSFDTLLHTGLMMAAASLISSLCAILGGYACATLSAQVGKDMRVALYEKSLKLSIYDFRQFGTASITTRTVSDITTIQFALTSFIQMVLPVPGHIHCGSGADLQPGRGDGLYSAGGDRGGLCAGPVHHTQRGAPVPEAAKAAGPACPPFCWKI